MDKRNQELIVKNFGEEIEKYSPVKIALDELNKNGYGAYIVGGSVRDFLMGKAPHDYDIATSAKPDEVKEVFKCESIIETGLKHGTLTLMMEGEPLEITTFRREYDYSDGRHPDKVEFSHSIEEDLERRDFTMNAIAFNPREGIVDPFDGSKDIEEKVIRAVGDPEERFNEDGLRILRALRFASVLGFEIEEKTANAALKSRQLLKGISAERIASEFNRLLEGEFAAEVIRKYWQIIAVFIPEIEAMVGFDQRNYHHIYDVLEHSLHVLDAVPRISYLRFAGLFHDIGKPASFTVDDEGVGHFYGHGKVGTEMVREILNRLKYDNDTKQRILTLVEWHDRRIEENEKSIKRAMGKLGEDAFFDLLEIKRGDALSQAPEFLGRLEKYKAMEEMARQILQEQQCFSRVGLAINGKDLIDAGIKEGPEIGKIIDMLVDKVIDGQLENKREILLEETENLAEEI